MPVTNNSQNPRLIDWYEDKFSGLDKSSSQYSISDQGLWELLNVIPIAPGRLQVVPGPTELLSGQSQTVIWAKPFQIGVTTYLVWCSNTGTLTIYNTVTNAVVATKTGLNGYGTDAAQWLVSELLIIDTSGYYSWDPTNGFVTISTTTVGNRIAVYQSRVWIFSTSSRDVQFTDAGSYTSFGGTGGAFKITNADAFDVPQGAAPFIGALYIWTSNAIITISGVQVVTQGSAQVAVFNVNTMEGTIGCPFHLGMFASGTTQLLANTYGVYNVQGSYPVKISERLNYAWSQVDFTGNVSMGIASMYGIFTYLICVKYPPDQSLYPSQTPYSIFGLTEKGEWWRANFGVNSLIVSEYVNGLPNCYAFDGSGNLYKLFSNPNAFVQHNIQTKLYNFGSPILRKRAQKMGIGILPIGGNPVVGLNMVLAGDSADEDLVSTQNFISNLNFNYVPPTANGFQWTYPNGTVFNVTTSPANYIFQGTGVNASGQIARHSRHLGLQLNGSTQPYALVEMALQVEPLDEWY